MNLKTILLIGALVPSLMLSAQADFRPLSGNQEIIDNCIDSVVYLVRQDYVLQSVNHPAMTYGRGGNKYFGRMYTLAVLADGKLWCDDKIITPWVGDLNYQEYETIDSLKPILFDAWARPLNKSKFNLVKPDTLLKITSYDSLMKISGIYTYCIDQKVKGLQMLSMNRSDAGWLILGSSDADLNLNDTALIKLSIYKEKPEFSPGELSGKIKNPGNAAKITGGFYILPSYSIGRVDWKLSGILGKKVLNYHVSLIPEMPVTVANAPEVKLPLTPINPQIPDKKSGNKQDNKKAGKRKADVTRPESEKNDTPK